MTTITTGDITEGGAILTSSSGTKVAVFVNASGDLVIYSDVDGTPSLEDSDTPTTIFGGGTIAAIHAAIDSNDDIHLIVACSAEQTRDIAYAVATESGGSWTIGAVISWEEASGYDEGVPDVPCVSIAIDSSDYPHILYTDSVKMTGSVADNVYYKERTGGSWSGATQIGVRNTKTDYHHSPSITIRGNDTIEAFYYKNTGSNLGSYRTNSGSWSGETDYAANELPGLPGILATTGGLVYRYGHAQSATYGEIYENNDSYVGYDSVDAQRPRVSAVLVNDSDRYVFFIDKTTNDVWLISNDGGGWTDEGALQTGTYTGVIAEWQYNNEHQSGEISYIYQDGTNVYYDSFLLGAAPQSVTLNELTLAGSPESLGDVTPGAVSQLLDVLTLASSPQFLYIPRTLTLDSLYLWSLLGVHYVYFTAATNSYINCYKGGNLDNIFQSKEATIEAWIKAESGDTLPFIIEKRSSGVGFSLYTNVDGRYYGEVGTPGLYPTSISVSGRILIDQDTWQHVVMYYNDNGDRKVYLAVDGVWESSYQTQRAAPTGSSVGDDSAINLWMGNQPGSSIYGWKGGISFARISNNDRYNHVSGFTPPARDELPLFPDANTLAQWNFYDRAGTTLTEFVDGKNGYITGSYWRVDGLDVSPGEATISTDELSLASSLESLTLSPGIVSILVDTLTLLSSAENITLQFGESTVILNVLTLISSLQSLAVSPGEASQLLDALTLASSLEPLSVLGSIAILLNVLSLSSSLESSTISPGIVSSLMDTLTLSGSLESLSSLSPGTVSVLLDALTLASSSENIGLSPGVVSQLLDTLTLASTIEDVSLSVSSSVTLNALTLVSSLEALNLSPGLVSTLLNELTLASTIESLNVSAGEASILLDVLTLASTIESLNLSPGTVSQILSTLTLSSSAENLSVIGAILILLDTLTLSSSIENISIGIDTSTIVLSTLSLLSSLESINLSVGNVDVILNALSLVSSSENLTVSPGAITMLVNALTLASSTDSLTVFADAVSLLMDELTLASSLESLNISAGSIAILLDALTLASSTDSISVLGGIIIALSALVLASSTDPITFSPGAISTILQTLVLSGSVGSITLGGAGSVTLNTLSLSSSVEAITNVPGSISIILDELTLTGSLESAEIVPGGISILVDTLTLSGTAEPITIDIAYRIVLQSLTLASSVEDIALSPGVISVLVDTLTLASSVEDIAIAVTALFVSGQLSISDGLIDDIIIRDALVSILEDSNSLVGDLIISDGEG